MEIIWKQVIKKKTRKNDYDEKKTGYEKMQIILIKKKESRVSFFFNQFFLTGLTGYEKNWKRFAWGKIERS